MSHHEPERPREPEPESGDAGIHGEDPADLTTLQRLIRSPFLALVRFYQVVLSPLTPPSCRFHPSCSAYTFTAIARFGPVRGIWLGTRRLLKCHPWNPGGVDYVPQRGQDGRPIRNNERHVAATETSEGTGPTD